MTREQKDNLFALLFIIGFSLSCIFNHVNEVLWTIGFILILLGSIGIFRKYNWCVIMKKIGGKF